MTDDEEKPGSLAIVVIADDAGEDTKSQSPQLAALIKEALALKLGDDRGVIALLAKAAALGLDEMQADMLIKAINKATKLGLRMMRAAWKVLVERAKAEAWTAGAAERERAKAEQEARWQHEREHERDRLRASCKELAENPKLLDEMEKKAHELGVVNEGAGVRAVYLTCTSRLLADEAGRLLRLGAPASGKNYAVEIVFAFVPADAIVQVSGSSPKSLAYYGGDDPDALKHKVVYIPEAQIIAARRGEESDFAIMLRSLISEGRIVYQTVVISDGPPETVTIIKNGPIAAIITTARNVDPELKTRLLPMDTDESGAQTVAIVESILSQARQLPELQSWLDLQSWLELDAPYRVDIPFGKAVFQAFEQWRVGFLEDAALRIRRDISSFLTVIKASAVLHKAQRETNADGAIVATLDDYAHAHAAFDEGLATEHGYADAKVIATVEAIEAIQVEELPDVAVKVTLRDLAKRLRVASPMTAGVRLAAALNCGAIEQDDIMSGRGGARYYRVLETSEALRKKPSLGVFPPREWVDRALYMATPRDRADKSDKRNEAPKKPAGETEERRI
jgi:hypothetical protein